MFQNKLEEVLANCLHDYEQTLPDTDQKGSENVLPFLREGIPPKVVQDYERYANCSMSPRSKKVVRRATEEWLKKEGKLD